MWKPLTHTTSDTLQCSRLNVVGVLKLKEGFLGVTKDHFFFFWADRLFNKDIPLLDLSNFNYYNVAPVLKALEKTSVHFDRYCKGNPKTYPKRVNKFLLAIIKIFLIQIPSSILSLAMTIALNAKIIWQGV